MKETKQQERTRRSTISKQAQMKAKASNRGEPKPGTYRKNGITLAGKDYSKDDPT